MASGTVTSKGQVTIPKEIRDYLKIDTGSQVDFVINRDGTVVLLPRRIDSSAISGMMHRPGKPAIAPLGVAQAIALEDMDEQIIESVAAEQPTRSVSILTFYFGI